MTRQRISAIVVLALLVSSSPAWAQPPQTRARNPTLALVGVLTMVAGAFQFGPIGEEYHIGPYDYCMKGQYTIDYGPCQVEQGRRPLGFALLAAGGAMTAIGLSRVTVYPMLKGGGVSYTHTW